jgi:uncharacterized membrane protein YfcA
VSGAIAIGLVGGIIAGLLGVGGGVLFVPGLVIFLGLDQHQAEATSLLAIIPVAIVGTYMQDRYGNVNRADALLLGLLSVAGAAAGVVLANALSGTVLRDAFAALMLLVAAQFVRRALGPGGGPAPAGRPVATRPGSGGGDGVDWDANGT